MRIVEISPYDMARPGGVQNHIVDLSRWLSRHGHETLILAPRPRISGALSGVRFVGRQALIRLHGTVTEISFASPADMAALRREIASFQPDIVHLHTPWTPLMPWQSWRSIGRPTVATFHATLPAPASLSSRLLLGAARYFLKRIDAGIVPSQVPLAALPRGDGISPVSIIPPAIDLGPWFSANGRSERRPGSVVFLGRLENRKGVDVLMRAWELARPSLAGGTLTIAGSGPLQRDVMAWCQDRPDARYLPAPDAATAQGLFAGADIVVAPSRHGESFGLVLPEAMAAGAVPVAASNAGYASTLDGPHAADLLYPPEDPARLAERLVSLTGDETRKRGIRDWGASRAREFDLPAVGPRYVDLFRQVLERRAGRD